ncbi:PREDICTED: dolichyl-diphosphooligosaccharide--protein glycosyltransferase subunit 1-like [Nicrophorus vespilloides]|uniref:Dolichyl-diphosphooligosaccharide--protein glycosyltransferase subunit 1 n=1 Tax=Nicrophorus vespilloides TaxID=110193 RepID=A0ABM1M5Q4_NICVS|nr:PREDICTED: dolichyl-diphosphooligosaccharide--protein glycosyltransferase subunit 1-like [Nicrophorus vespilloides]
MTIGSKMVVIAFISFLLIIGVRSEFVNTFVDRRVNLETQLIRVWTTVRFIRHGSESENIYEYLIDDYEAQHYVRFTDRDGSILDHKLMNDETVHVNLSNEQDLFHVEEVFWNCIVVLQKRKPFRKPDYIRYIGNIYYYSRYTTLRYNVKYVIDTHYYVNIEPHVVNNYTSEYKFTNPLAALSKKRIEFEIITSKPLIHVISLERIIDVSHYGRISIHERVVLQNNGAKVIGSYKPTAKEWFYTFLPSSAEDVHLYDTLGVRYNWKFVPNENYTSIEFRSRFPLLGGWKYSYDLSYTVPSYEYLYVTDEARYLLKMRVFDHVLNDAIIDSFVTKVILPENSVNYDVLKPDGFPSDISEETTITTLSCFGRKTVVIAGGSVIENHIDDFIIEYSIGWINMLRVPLKLSLWLYIAFICIIFTIRFSAWISLK